MLAKIKWLKRWIRKIMKREERYEIKVIQLNKAKCKNECESKLKGGGEDTWDGIRRVEEEWKQY